jgi:VIT1/CCC1 family predicted Fe2+/Mn2+ transporter
MPRESHHVEPRGLLSIARHYIGDLVYGANDGVVTTFAAIAGAEGGALTSAVVLIVGVANLLADGLSMGIGNYLSIRAREQGREAEGLPEEEARPAPYLWTASQSVARPLSAAAAVATLFTIGAMRGVVTARPWWRGGVEVLSLGAIAGVAAYAAGAVVGHLLRH